MEKFTIKAGDAALSARVQLADGGATVYYNRDTKVGRRLLSNVGSIREIQANYIRQAFNLSRNMNCPAKVEFVSVSA